MGFSPAEIQAAIGDVLNLARATGTDWSEAGDIAANSLRIFGLEAEKMCDISDVLTVTANSSAHRYFVPDKRKSGGAIVEVFKIVKKSLPQTEYSCLQMGTAC